MGGRPQFKFSAAPGARLSSVPRRASRTSASQFAPVIQAVPLTTPLMSRHCYPPQATRDAPMYYNVFGEKVSRARYREMLVAAKKSTRADRRRTDQPARPVQDGITDRGRNAGRQDRLEFARLRPDRERRDKPNVLAQQSAGQPTDQGLHRTASDHADCTDGSVVDADAYPCPQHRGRRGSSGVAPGAANRLHKVPGGSRYALPDEAALDTRYPVARPPDADHLGV